MGIFQDLGQSDGIPNRNEPLYKHFKSHTASVRMLGFRSVLELAPKPIDI
jgi:hypothetical protein